MIFNTTIEVKTVFTDEEAAEFKRMSVVERADVLSNNKSAISKLISGEFPQSSTVEVTFNIQEESE